MWAKGKGDKKLFVKDTVEVGSCLKYFKEGNQIAELFQKLKKEFKLGNEDVYFVLPDEMFEMTDTANTENEVELRRFVEDSTGLDFSEVYISIPIQATPGQYKK